jgi:large subunit ribosomal protein L5
MDQEQKNENNQSTSSKTRMRPSSNSIPRLLERYRAEIIPALQEEFKYDNPMEIPKLTKVVLNVGLGEALVNSNAVDSVTRLLAAISGQKAVSTKAKKSIAAFKLREGNTIGAMVTLRSHRMYQFVDRMINAALPRIRDFRGVSRTSFDGRGGYSMGIREQVIFPEIDYNQIDKIRGFQVTLLTTAKTNEQTFRLLELLGMPFARVS